MKPVQKIQKMLKALDAGGTNRTDDIYINVVRNEFITFPDRILIPKIPVKELPYDLSVAIVKMMTELCPEFLFGHELLEGRIPPSEQHSLHFAKWIPGHVIDFIHLLKVDFRFGGDSSNIENRGDSDNYPSYYTNRFYYKSLLIPTTGISGDGLNAFQSMRLFDTTRVDSDQYFHTFAVFEEVNRKELTKEILSKIDRRIFTISPDLYPFIVYDYFTACLNVLYPTPHEITRAAELYEPVFIAVLSTFKTIEDMIDGERIREHFHRELSGEGAIFHLREPFLDQLAEYFHRFSIVRDDELALKEWWRIDVAPLSE